VIQEIQTQGADLVCFAVRMFHSVISWVKPEVFVFSHSLFVSSTETNTISLNVLLMRNLKEHLVHVCKEVYNLI
jgi:hypothetical protein